MKLTFHDLIEDLNFHKNIVKNFYDFKILRFEHETLKRKIKVLRALNISSPYAKYIDDPIIFKKKYYRNSKRRFLAKYGLRFYFYLACHFLTLLVFYMQPLFSNENISLFLRRYHILKLRYFDCFIYPEEYTKRYTKCLESGIKLRGGDKYFEPRFKIYSPNLTIYTPLHSALISVSIRFMGFILLLLFTFILNVFLVLYIYNISTAFIIFIFIFILGLIFLTSFIHMSFSMYHILSKLTKLKFSTAKMRQIDHLFYFFIGNFVYSMEKYYEIKEFLKKYEIKIFGITIKLYDDEIPEGSKKKYEVVVQKKEEEEEEILSEEEEYTDSEEEILRL